MGTKTELRRWLDDEIAAMADPMAAWEAEARAFWSDPGRPGISIRCAWPPDEPVASPPWPGSVTEEELYGWVMRYGRTALESRRRGFSTVPVVYPHDRHYRGPAFRTRFLPVVMGAAVRYPEGVDVAVQDGWLAGVDPLIGSVAELDRLRAVDVAKSPAQRAVLQGYEEIHEIVRGRICCTHYVPTCPLDMAADVIGHCRFYELAAGEPEQASELLDVCTDKWVEIVRQQEAAVGGRWADAYYERGLRISDMILRFMGPEQVRRVALPYNARLGARFGGAAIDTDHPDSGLLDDFLAVPGLTALGVPETWNGDRVVAAVGGRCCLKISFDWHYHEGKKKAAPICKPWKACRDFIARIAGRVRVLVTLTGWGDTVQERRDCISRDRDDLLAAWEGRAAAGR